MRKLKSSDRTITPQRVYGTAPAVCRDCKYCLANGNDRIRAHYCIRFFGREDPRGRVNAYDQACGKFEKE